MAQLPGQEQIDQPEQFGSSQLRQAAQLAGQERIRAVLRDQLEGVTQLPGQEQINQPEQFGSSQLGQAAQLVGQERIRAVLRAQPRTQQICQPPGGRVQISPRPRPCQTRYGLIQ